MSKFNILHRRQLAHAKRVAMAAMQAKVQAMTDSEIEAALDNPVGQRLKLMSDEELLRIAEG